MAEGKRYYWLKLKDDFFTSRRMKKLRKIAGGDCYTIIYLKLQLLSLKTEGHLYYDGIEESFAAELALDIDEDAENVAMTMQFLINTQLAEMSEDGCELYLPWVTASTGSEGASAKRVRDFRQREQTKLLAETPALLQSNASALQCNIPVTERKSKSKDIEKDIEKDTYTADKPQRVFNKPTLQEVKEYCTEKGYHFDPEEFIDHYEANGWKVGRTAMKDWKATCRTWERRNAEYGRKPISGADTSTGTAGRFDGLQLYDA